MLHTLYESRSVTSTTQQGVTSKKASAGSTYTSGRLREAKCGYQFGICDCRSPQSWFAKESLDYPRPPLQQPSGS